MASYRSFPTQSSFPPPPNQNPIPPPPPQRGNQFPPNRGFSGGAAATGSHQQQPPNYNHTGYTSSSSSTHHYQHPRPPPQQQQQQQQYPYQHPPPPPSQLPQHPLYPPAAPPPSSQPPPPIPPMYYPSSSASQYSQFNPHSVQPPLPPAAPPPPPPSSPPPSNSIPPPPPSNPPPSHPPPPPPPPSSSSNPIKESRPSNYPTSRGGHKESNAWRESKHAQPPKQHKPSVAPVPPGRAPHVPNGPAGRIETPEERKLRKKKEYEKQKQEEKHRQLLKESQNTVLHKTTQMLSSGVKAHGSIAGSRMGDKRTPFLTGERIENRLKKPTTFLCKLKFRNELPDPTAQPKLLSMNTNKDQYTKYTITTLEKMHKPKLFVEPDLGIPLDLLDISVYNPPSTPPPLAPEDEELLRDTELTTPVKQNGIRRKERPDDKGVSWLVKTQYISPLSMDQAKMSLTEKQAKELRETRGGRNILENLNDRESQIKAIQASFEACKSRPVHATNPKLQPVEVLPLLPDFDRYDDQFVLASFDNDPTADSEAYSKLEQSQRDDLESQAIMKSFVGGSDPAKQEKFLAYMVPSPNELWKDMYDEREDVSYTWVREYHWDVRGDDADDPTTYLVSFNDDAAHYLPLGTKLVLRKKRATEGRSSDEVEHYPVPSKLTVRHRSTVAAIEVKESGGYINPKGDTPNSKRGRSSNDDALEPRHKNARLDDMDNFSEAEELSE